MKSHEKIADNLHNRISALNKSRMENGNIAIIAIWIQSIERRHFVLIKLLSIKYIFYETLSNSNKWNRFHQECRTFCWRVSVVKFDLSRLRTLKRNLSKREVVWKWKVHFALESEDNLIPWATWVSHRSKWEYFHRIHAFQERNEISGRIFIGLNTQHKAW